MEAGDDFLLESPMSVFIQCRSTKQIHDSVMLVGEKVGQSNYLALYSYKDWLNDQIFSLASRFGMMSCIYSPH